MKRLVLIMLTTCLGVLPASALVAQTGEPSRTIHLVYDDSGSMIHNDAGEYLDTWCQARYAMEVVAAMLGPGDKLDIFYMSSYDAEPHSLRGSAGAQANVAETRRTRTKAFFICKFPMFALVIRFQEARRAVCRVRSPPRRERA